jgi:TRAP-type C4-dicarboxylate transport system permease small subunit
MNNKLQKAIRLIALIACCLFIAAVLLSASYIIIHENHTHDCDGPDGSCAVCINIAAAKSLLKTSLMTIIAEFIAIGSFNLLFLLCLKCSCFESFSPVTLKVKMNA